MSDDARRAVLGRIRAALTDVPADEPTLPAAAAPDAGARGGGADLFAERVADYRATVTRCGARAVPDTVAAICSRHRAARLACPAGLPAAWLPAGLGVRRDDPPLSVAELDALDGVVTGAAAAIAPTGTILLDGGGASGRRALTLVPDLHICIVSADQVVDGVPRGLDEVRGAIAAGRPVTLVSGPSATSDIELDRVEGVHGPRRLEVVLVDGAR